MNQNFTQNSARNSKIGFLKSLVKNYKNLQVYWLTASALTAMTVKAVYEVSNSWYG